MVRAVAIIGVVLAALTPAMQLQSGDFTPGGVIPAAAMADGCGGNNRSPQLSWSGAPKDTRSFALIVHDPDAPISGGFYHWVVYNLPPATHGLAPNIRLAPDQLGETTNGKAGYSGPCPPPGPTHHYAFTLYALDIAHIAADAPLTALQLQDRVAGHVLARAILTGIESHH